mmetsp:Transcript_12575/g.33466  ORF Transcript_12575/g.33466 Transcript_12575/m.33466 type:complete len:209 (-) Transcript_12575:192-818(-)
MPTCRPTPSSAAAARAQAVPRAAYPRCRPGARLRRCTTSRRLDTPSCPGTLQPARSHQASAERRQARRHQTAACSAASPAAAFEGTRQARRSAPHAPSQRAAGASRPRQQAARPSTPLRARVVVECPPSRRVSSRAAEPPTTRTCPFPHLALQERRQRRACECALSRAGACTQPPRRSAPPAVHAPRYAAKAPCGLGMMDGGLERRRV